MAISEKQQAEGLEHLRQIRRKYFSCSSRAADWWDKLTPEWRGVVLHAAAVSSGSKDFKAHLSKCCWRELFERLDYRAMIKLKRGISAARQRFEGFGALSDGDFSPRTANRPVKKVYPIKGNGSVQMVIAPDIVNRMLQGDLQ
ncbi:hypothetical protein L8O47_08520 [Enterobacter roggenkampii]|uniref:hypothetical protein n=1 Tax=Enterobacter roggenkampii TaxID=1812935 RepID=UPI002006AB5C|nr:hypothetical protein [Enterobacter roggenkampii]MCK7150945.1 hypothetical protein [Enterobacter roggenkampii]